MTRSSEEYWQNRSTINLIENEKLARQYELKLREVYDDTISVIKKEIEAFYGRYAIENQITLQEARKRLSSKELTNFNKQAQEYIREVEKWQNKIFTQEYLNYLRQLSGRAYITKMEELIVNIRHNIEKLASGYNTGLGDILQEAYENSFYNTIFDIRNKTNTEISFTQPGEKQLKEAIKEKWLGQNYSDRIWNEKQKLVENLNQLIPREFVLGRGPESVGNTLAERLNVSYSNAQRLIRTEMNYISNNASITAYKESGIVKQYQYSATLDGRTSDICIELDRRIFDLKEAKTGINLPPMHPNCRSTTIPYFPDDIDGNLIEDRIARDENGNSYRLGENLEYLAWAEQRGSKKFQDNIRKRRIKFINEVYSNPYLSYFGQFNIDPNDIQVGDHSIKKFLDDNGNLSMSREKLHRTILEDLFKDALPADGVPTFTLMGGGPASGKSSVIETGMVKLPKFSVVVDPDAIKAKLPEYNKLLNDPDIKVRRAAAQYVHEESSALTKRAIEVATKLKFNYTLDGTGDGSIKSLTKKIEQAKKAGYKVEGVYVTVPTQVAINRSMKRAEETGRYVDPNVISTIHKKVSQILPECANLFDSIELYDTTNGIRKIGIRSDDGKLVPTEGNEELFNNFIEKGKE